MLMGIAEYSSVFTSSMLLCSISSAMLSTVEDSTFDRKGVPLERFSMRARKASSCSSRPT
eukprot:5512848-Karenia_brevis.AAC.1